MKALTCVGVREWGGQRPNGLVDQYLVALEISDDSFIPGAGLWPHQGDTKPKPLLGPWAKAKGSSFCKNRTASGCRVCPASQGAFALSVNDYLGN